MRKVCLLFMLLSAAVSLLIHTTYAQTKISDGFVFIKGGTFMMGGSASDAELVGYNYDNEIPHKVTVSSFYMSKYQVTQKEYREMMEDHNSFFKGDNFPVENVNWYDAIEYCNKRSIKEGLTPAYTIDKDRKDPNNIDDNKCKDWNDCDDLKWFVTWNRKANGYRLPTEAEWEYACRAGTTTPFNTGDDITADQANFKGYSRKYEKMYRKKTTPVGSFAPNPWGLYDMHGNVDEWCWDWYGDYKTAAQKDPTGAVSGAYRVVRGGSWDNSDHTLRSAFRYYYTPLKNRNSRLGFRLVRQ